MRRLTRRGFLAHSAAVSALAALNASAIGNDRSSQSFQICAFEKYLQDLSYDELAEVIAELGFNGIEATVRKHGHVLPERVEHDLPKLVEALKKHNLEVTIMATNIASVDDPHARKILQTAASLGIKQYRMWYYEYNAQESIADQLIKIKPKVNDLAAFNRELGMGAIYQNHAGERYVGSTLWDLERLLRDVAVNEIGCAFDIRHATAVTGSSWPIVFRLMQPHIAAIYVKDFCWQNKKIKNVALGTGQVDPRFFQMLKDSPFSGPISLHVEYLEQGSTEENIVALKTDLQVLRDWLAKD